MNLLTKAGWREVIDELLDKQSQSLRHVFIERMKEDLQVNNQSAIDFIKRHPGRCHRQLDPMPSPAHPDLAKPHTIAGLHNHGTHKTRAYGPAPKRKWR